MTQIINVTSEALQATLRRLLPSQAGFSEDVQASNLIQPIIDLTPTAEGSILPTYLQNALDVTTTLTTALNQTQVVTSTPGFYILRLNVDEMGVGGDTSVQVNIVSSLTTTTVLQTRVIAGTGSVVFPDVVVFLNINQELQLVSNAGNAIAILSSRQVATLNGELVNPSGCQPQSLPTGCFFYALASQLPYIGAV